MSQSLSHAFSMSKGVMEKFVLFPNAKEKKKDPRIVFLLKKKKKGKNSMSRVFKN